MSTTPRPRGPVDTRVFQLVPGLRRDALVLGGLAALGALALLGQLIAVAWAVTAYASGKDLWLPVGSFVAIKVVRSLLRAFEHQRTAAAAGRARVAVGGRLVAAALRMAPSQLATTGPGTVSALATNGADTLEKYVTRYLPAVIPAVLLPPAVIVLLALLDFRSAVIVVLTLPLIPVFAALVGWLTEKRAAQQWQLMSRLSAHFLDVVQGLVTLRAYRRADRQVEVLAEVGERHRAATVRVLRIAFLSGTALDLVATLSVGLVAVEAGLRVAAGELQLGTALVAILIAPEAYRPVRELGARFHESADATSILDEVGELLQAVPETGPVAEPASAPGGSISGGTSGGSLPSGVALVAEGLTVGAPGRAEPVLSGVGLWAFSGQITALTGPSGVGKTTLLRVLAGVLTPSAGSVRCGAPVVYLPQQPTFPLARTLREAVVAGWPEAPDQVIAEALRDAAASDWIAALPAGLDTSLGEDGRDLSAGQRQRIAVARALVQASRRLSVGAPIVLLDEPSAHLDEQTERAVLAGLRRRADQGACIVMVAHRPAAIAAADEVSQLWGVRPASGPAGGAQLQLGDNRLGGQGGRGGDVPVVAVARPEASNARSWENDSGLPGFGKAWADAKPARPWIPARFRRTSMNLALVLGTLSSLSGVALTAVAAWLLTKASFQPPVLTLTVAVVGVRLFAVTRPLFSYLDRVVAHDVALADLGKLRSRVYADLVPRVPGPALPRRGDLLTRLVDDVDAVGDSVLRWRRPAVVAAATVVVALIVAAVISPLAALAALPGLLLAGIIAPVVAGAGADQRAARTAEARAGYSQTVVEVLSGAEDVNALGAADSGVKPVRSAGRHAVEVDQVQVRRTALAELLRMAGAGLAVAGVMLAAVGAGGLSLEQFGVLALGTLALGDVTATLPDAVNARTRGRIAERRLNEVLETPPPSVEPVAETGAETGSGTGVLASGDAEGALAGASVAVGQRASLPVSAGAQLIPAQGSFPGEDAVLQELDRACGEGMDLDELLLSLGVVGRCGDHAPRVRLTDVTAGWNPDAEPVLRNLDLNLSPGFRIAVQGPSGCGKSTLAALVLKFLDPRGGRVSLGGENYQQLAGDRVREVVGLVSDDDHVFASTLRENLKLAKPGADDAELRVALTRARLGQWFNALPDGLDTWLGERGATLSAGERRRLALARALLADRPVLVLDEPAESLDAETAEAVLDDMLQASGGRSVLLVTHRGEGLGQVDQVLRLQEGRLQEGQLRAGT
ncbi:thiol reductant ABC exporter subunit CydD [Kineosporia babensis]|uniref:Thiol reductant ABC exporter subunit CydD n=1 Tax=Kineosporia babensis TaxID=499548 RepID=A0A9X1NE82_9ACTN|nr:thiol reductant ABC exporter subunit CydD [Kineosporia babensis]MCD5312209.1 thiol reductant ABC exporter subunit CydD [Kineosporia babensis]